MKNRCSWANHSEIYSKYHDEEWGKPLHDDQKLFEFLILEGMQAGLSWITILKKREAFREAFAGFDAKQVAAFEQDKLEELMNNQGIIRNKLKIEAAVTNAKSFLKIVDEVGSFDAYIWKFVDHKPLVNHWEKLSEIPARTELSDQISNDLKRRGFKFVGSTIVYAHMQATGMVNDHLVSCSCHHRAQNQTKSF